MEGWRRGSPGWSPVRASGCTGTWGAAWSWERERKREVRKKGGHTEIKVASGCRMGETIQNFMEPLRCAGFVEVLRWRRDCEGQTTAHVTSRLMGENTKGSTAHWENTPQNNSKGGGSSKASEEAESDVSTEGW